MRADASLVVLLGVALFGAPVHADPESPEYPHVRLTIDPSPAPNRWILRIQNIDSVPLRLVADPHLLTLDVVPPGAHAATIHCALPPEMRPDTDEDRVVVVPPQLSYVDAFDPRLYCFSTREERALVVGASVVGRFGFAASRSKRGPPYVVSSGNSERSANREVVGDPVTLPEPPTDVLPPRPEKNAAAPPPAEPAQAPRMLSDEKGAAKLAISTPARIDTARLRDLTLPVTVKNTTARTIHLMLRPDTVVIDAKGPDGTLHCQSAIRPTVIAELMTTLPPHGGTTTEVLVSSLCPASFFSRPGLYFLRASVDMSGTSGAEAEGVRAFKGEASSASLTLVRLRTVKVVDERP
jgi:hypothetical protein